MTDQSPFSEDISALWGPDDDVGLEPAPLRRLNPTPRPEQVLDGRLSELERRLTDLTEAVAASASETVDRADLNALLTELRAEIGADLRREVAKLRAEILARLDDGDRAGDPGTLPGPGQAELPLAEPGRSNGHEHPSVSGTGG